MWDNERFLNNYNILVLYIIYLYNSLIYILCLSYMLVIMHDVGIIGIDW